MKTSALIIFLGAVCVAEPSNLLMSQWNDFKITHKKSYSSNIEEQSRLEIFSENLKRIEKHNARYDQGLESYYLGVTQFADMNKEEFKAYVGLSAEKPKTKSDADSYYIPSNVKDLPDSMDLREQNVLGPIKQQGHCGSCWAFATISTIETRVFLKTGNITTLSEQNSVDCSREPPNNGCSGGSAIIAFEYMEKYGIDTEEDYPYEAVDGECRYDDSKSIAKVWSYTMVHNKIEDIKSVLVNEGAPIIAFYDTTDWDLYKGGVFYRPDAYNFNHVITLIGYGSEDGKDYLIVRNSWGTGWGEEGYMKMSIDTPTADISFPRLELV